MQGISKEFATLIQTSHQHIARIDVVLEGVVIRTLNVHAGSVDADRGNRFMRRFTATVADADGELTPEDMRSLLAPFGVVLKLYRGVRIPVIVENNSLNETTEDWDAGKKYGVQANGSGYLVMGSPGHT